MYSAENNIRNTARQTKERQGRSRRTQVDDLRQTGMKIHDDIKFGTLPLLHMYQHVSTIVRCQYYTSELLLHYLKKIFVKF